MLYCVKEIFIKVKTMLSGHKFKTGDEVYVIFRGRVQSATITEVHTSLGRGFPYSITTSFGEQVCMSTLVIDEFTFKTRAEAEKALFYTKLTGKISYIPD